MKKVLFIMMFLIIGCSDNSTESQQSNNTLVGEWCLIEFRDNVSCDDFSGNDITTYNNCESTFIFSESTLNVDGYNYGNYNYDSNQIKDDDNYTLFNYSFSIDTLNLWYEEGNNGYCNYYRLLGN